MSVKGTRHGRRRCIVESRQPLQFQPLVARDMVRRGSQCVALVQACRCIRRRHALRIGVQWGTAASPVRLWLPLVQQAADSFVWMCVKQDRIGHARIAGREHSSPHNRFASTARALDPLLSLDCKPSVCHRLSRSHQVRRRLWDRPHTTPQEPPSPVPANFPATCDFALAQPAMIKGAEAQTSALYRATLRPC